MLLIRCDPNVPGDVLGVSTLQGVDALDTQQVETTLNGTLMRADLQQRHCRMPRGEMGRTAQRWSTRLMEKGNRHEDLHSDRERRRT